MADQNSQSALPPLSLTTGSSAPSNTGIPVTFPTEVEGTSSKQMLIGGGVLLALAIIFFFIRNSYVNYLVGSQKRSPNNAGMAGWGLFGGLLFASAIGCAAIVNTAYLSALVIGPLAGISLVCFVLAFVVAAKK